VKQKFVQTLGHWDLLGSFPRKTSTPIATHLIILPKLHCFGIWVEIRKCIWYWDHPPEFRVSIIKKYTIVA